MDQRLLLLLFLLRAAIILDVPVVSVSLDFPAVPVSSDVLIAPVSSDVLIALASLVVLAAPSLLDDSVITQYHVVTLPFFIVTAPFFSPPPTDELFLVLQEKFSLWNSQGRHE